MVLHYSSDYEIILIYIELKKLFELMQKSGMQQF